MKPETRAAVRFFPPGIDFGILSLLLATNKQLVGLVYMSYKVEVDPAAPFHAAVEEAFTFTLHLICSHMHH